MSNMRERIEDDTIFTYGCQAHVINLLVGDIKSKHEQSSVKIVSVLRTFRNIHALRAEISVRKIKVPQLPTVTRWCSVIEAYKYYNDYWQMLVEVASKELPINHIDRKTLENLQVRSFNQKI